MTEKFIKLNQLVLGESDRETVKKVGDKMTAQPISIIKIYICYAPEDDRLRRQLAKHLMSLRRLRYITGWFDRDVQAGTNWVQELETRLDAADIILVLVSSDLIDSQYCYTKEMKRALERQRAGTALIIPIIVRPADWEETPLGNFAALPEGNKPVTTWSNRDSAWFAVEQGVRKVVRELLANQTLTPEEVTILNPPPEPPKKKSLLSLLKGGKNEEQEEEGYQVAIRSRRSKQNNTIQENGQYPAPQRKSYPGPQYKSYPIENGQYPAPQRESHPAPPRKSYPAPQRESYPLKGKE